MSFFFLSFFELWPFYPLCQSLNRSSQNAHNLIHLKSTQIIWENVEHLPVKASNRHVMSDPNKYAVDAPTTIISFIATMGDIKCQFVKQFVNLLFVKVIAFMKHELTAWSFASWAAWFGYQRRNGTVLYHSAEVLYCTIYFLIQTQSYVRDELCVPPTWLSVASPPLIFVGAISAINTGTYVLSHSSIPFVQPNSSFEH